MRKVGMAELRRKWSEVVERARRGESSEIAKRGRVYVLLGDSAACRLHVGCIDLGWAAP
jgi:prevent-host-death family protein